MRQLIQKVLITDPIDAQFVQALKTLGLDVVQKTLTEEQLLKEIPDYEMLIVRSGTQVTRKVINAGQRLKLIGRAGTGVDNIDVPAATEQGILVMNTPGSNTISACEHTCALILALSRHIPPAYASLKEGRWDRKLYMGHEVMGKTLAIFGLGRIGRELAIRMRAFGMRCVGFDPYIPAEAVAEFGIEFMEPERIWPIADFISIHVPLLAETENLINLEVLHRCKKGVKIINVARGGIVSEADLLTGLNDGQVGGAALDVFSSEPPSPSVLTLIKHPRVLATPHLGASTVEAQERVAEDLAQQITILLETGRAPGLVNRV
ncbi:D-3-phosphoglycerate dehydrogenase-like [Paramacrobiotus metropolitanus]|uniref:D-3-phosphoglycerate dehydrogenase-like n=1 Tax=Paramacrobiotus metropolitanus TaxID=2943436 RepID=UPI0024464E5F|nr:D-3-phosphoglycerate dehydrogenase-like [Paramacrobiotus metropolitanus]